LRGIYWMVATVFSILSESNYKSGRYPEQNATFVCK
jgi:hypothetical protein